MWPSLSIAIPVLLLGITINILLAMMMAFFRSSYLDLSGVIFCIIMMSISTMALIVKYLDGKIFEEL